MGGALLVWIECDAAAFGCLVGCLECVGEGVPAEAFIEALRWGGAGFRCGVAGTGCGCVVIEGLGGHGFYSLRWVRARWDTACEVGHKGVRFKLSGGILKVFLSNICSSLIV